MHVSTMVRRTTALLVALVAASACSEAPGAPRMMQRPSLDVSALQPDFARGDVAEHGPLGPTDEKIKTFMVDPKASKTYAFGKDWIYFPAHSICDPATSGYGLDLWDTPCTPLDKPIQITVHWSARGGHAFVHFSPELRFVPADAHSTSNWVVLSLHDHRELLEQDAYSILYNPDGTNTWIDESLTDPTLCAWIDLAHNSVYRRVKHFSGYLVSAAYSDNSGGFGNAY